MSDESKSAVPGQGENGQPAAPAPSAPSGEPAEGTTEQGGQAEQKPEFLTRAEAEAMVQDALNQARSYADKGRIRAEKAAQEAQEMVKKMRDYGTNISDEEASKIVAAAKQKAIEEPDADEEPAPDASAQMQKAAQYFAESNLGAYDLKMQGKYSVELTVDDPEVKSFELTGDHQKDAANIEAMYQAKQNRLASEQTNQSNTDEAASNSNARIPGALGSTPVVQAKEAKDLWKVAHR